MLGAWCRSYSRPCGSLKAPQLHQSRVPSSASVRVVSMPCLDAACTLLKRCPWRCLCAALRRLQALVIYCCTILCCQCIALLCPAQALPYACLCIALRMLVSLFLEFLEETSKWLRRYNGIFTYILIKSRNTLNPLLHPLI